jgi:hypothetical protein
MKTITTEIVINANKDLVWKILTDFNSYPNWNPFITQIQGELKTGSRFNVTLNIQGRKPTSFQPDIISMTPGEKFCWKGKLFIKGLFDGTHYFILEGMEDEKTLFRHGENFTGLLTGPVLRKIGGATREAFDRMNLALKERAEK